MATGLEQPRVSRRCLGVAFGYSRPKRDSAVARFSFRRARPAANQMYRGSPLDGQLKQSIDEPRRPRPFNSREPSDNIRSVVRRPGDDLKTIADQKRRAFATSYSRRRCASLFVVFKRYPKKTPILVVVLAQLTASACHGRRDPSESSHPAEVPTASIAGARATASSAPTATTTTQPAELLNSLVPVVHPMRFEPSPNSAKTSIRLVGPRAFDAMANTYVFFEIENDGPQPAIPDVVLKFADERGKPIGSARCSVATVVVLAKERVPCSLGAPLAATSASYEISTAPDAAAARAKDLRLQFVVKQAKLGSFPQSAASPVALPVVTGVVVNPTREPGTAAVQVAFYDEEGRIVSVAEAQVAGGPIRPGASAPFSAPSTLFIAAQSFSATAYAISTR